MMRTGQNGDKVGFSAATWVGLITIAVMVALPTLTSFMRYENRVTTLETTSTEHTRRLNEGDARDDGLRKEILTELKELRQQITK